MEASLSQPDKPELDIVPYEASAISSARYLLDLVKARSPRTLLGISLLRELARELNAHRSNDKSPITVFRLSLAMRRVVEASKYLVPGSMVPEGLTLGLFEDPEPVRGTAKTLPNADAAKVAKRKLTDTSAAIDKVEATLMGPELARFAHFDPDALVPLRMEMERLKTLVRIPFGLQRGRPTLSWTVQSLHGVFFELTGSWLRERHNPARRDRFISNALFNAMRPLTPVDFSDEDLGRTIETAIRKRKNRAPKVPT